MTEKKPKAQGPLRVVGGPGQASEPAPRRGLTVLEAAEKSERDLLITLRNKLAKALDLGTVPAHALDKVARQVREFDKAIRLIDSQDDEGDDVGQAVATPDEEWAAT